ncbi:TVP38/TMEM64 family protein [Candidatus Pelagibacter sp. Uisw_134_02]|uniref:TVP38/TMEM64 family protein n=1 Tax=Candidatus Pelagibacter sp. Uisw_134_02 TaxID=3230990 RepID=UPI0039E9AB0E
MHKLIRLFNYKIMIALCYLVLIFFFFSFFFDFQFNKEEIVNFLITNKDKLDHYIENNIFNLFLVFFIFSILWTICLGFGLPTMMLAAYLFDPLNGTLLLVASKTIGVAIIFIFYKKIFKENFFKKRTFKQINQKKITKLVKKNELYYLILLRLFPGIPVQVIDIFPLFIGVKFKNYLLSKFLGSLLPHYLIINFFNSFYKNLENNLSTSLDLSVTTDLLLAFLVFSLFIILGNFIKKKLKLDK